MLQKKLLHIFSLWMMNNYFLLNEAPEEIPEDYEFNTVRELRNLQIGPKYRTFAAITGLHLYNWYRTNVSVDAVDTRPFILPQNVL